MNYDRLINLIKTAVTERHGNVFEVSGFDQLDFPALIVIVPVRRIYFVRIVDESTDVLANPVLVRWSELAGRLGTSGGFFIRSDEDVQEFSEYLKY